MSTIYTREQAKAQDKVLYEAMLALADKNARHGLALSDLHHVVGDSYRRRYDARSGWKLTHEEAVAKAQEIAATDTTYVGRQAQEGIDRLAKAQEAVEVAKAEEKAADHWADHGRWPRYAVVPGGHIHKETGCFTLRWDTDVRWAYPVSGDSVEEAIAEYGEALCSHCYPDAPVAQTLGKVEVDADGHPISKAQAQAIRDAKAAEKAAKLAAKEAKMVFVPGTKNLVRGPDKYEIKSEVTLVREIVSALAKRSDGRSFYASKLNRQTGENEIDTSYPTYGEWVAYAIEALAAKHGKTVEEVKAEMDKKLRAKNARQGY